MSGTIKENLIPQETSTDPEVLKDMFVRFVTALGTGSSKNKKVSELILKIANIYGLQTALDSKIGKNVSGGTGVIPTYLADGDIDFSTFKIGTFDSSASIGSLVDNGFYTAAGTGSAYENAIMGNVCAVFVFNNTQTVYSSDRGMWYRIYSIVDHYSGWSIPSYIGGSVNNISVSRAQADWLVANNSLTVGANYAIVDYTTTGYEQIVIEAATSSTFKQDGLALLSVPIHRAVLDDTIGGELLHFKGCWRSTGTYAYGDVVWFFGQMYSNLTGNTGSIRDTYFLNIADWNYLQPDIYPEFYTVVKHGVTYDFATNFVRKEWDEYGNEFGDGLLQADGFQARYNDWELLIDSATETVLYSDYSHNKTERFYNNFIDKPASSTDFRQIIIKNNKGEGWAYENNIVFGENTGLASISNNTLNSRFVGGVLLRGYLTNQNLVFDGGYWPIRVDGNTIIGGSLVSNSLIMPVGEDEESSISDNTVYGSIHHVTTTGHINIVRNTVYGQITGADASVIDTNVQEGVITVNSATVSDSTLYTTRTFTANTSRQESKGLIFASLYIGTGEFSFDRDSAFHVPQVETGCLVTEAGKNGVTVTGSDINTLAITIVHAGYYSVKYEATAQSPVKIDVESKAYKGATAIPMLYNKKTYTAIDEWINSSMSGIVQLAAGDVITAKYASPGSGTATLLLGQINITLEYKGQ